MPVGHSAWGQASRTRCHPGLHNLKGKCRASTHPGQLSVRNLQSQAVGLPGQAAAHVCRLKGLPWWGQRGHPPKRKPQSEVHSHGLQVNVVSSLQHLCLITPSVLSHCKIIPWCMFLEDAKTDPPVTFHTAHLSACIKGFLRGLFIHAISQGLGTTGNRSQANPLDSHQVWILVPPFP